MPLKPEYKAITLAALRSGTYTQETGDIGNYNSKKLCCIGVAAHANNYPVHIGFETTLLAARFLGLTDEEMQEWVDWNDQERHNFKKIADLIEAKY